MTPLELFDAIEDAVERAPRGRRRIVLELTRRDVLGQRGRYLGSDEVGPRYGFTRRQCHAMLNALAEAARADAGIQP